MKIYTNNNYEAEESYNRTLSCKLNDTSKAVIKMKEYYESERR